ncbi:MAG: FmdB family transcriptional regulator [Actinomycetota bacterium]|jgi:putative FmdB family regulatory protein|nr:FmdB family transcriptional regulator [Rubrobacter sp.]MDQ3508962.1 FmdB family transcriptional regulator [Actinomycetota bacterium]
MPIYEYKCENNHVFDIMQKMADDSLTQCVECGAPVRKIMHPVGISFKGSGFYSTDYSGKSKADPAAKSESSDSAAKSDSSNGDSKNGSGDSSKESKKSDKSDKSDSSSSTSSASSSSSSKKD